MPVTKPGSSLQAARQGIANTCGIGESGPDADHDAWSARRGEPAQVNCSPGPSREVAPGVCSAMPDAEVVLAVAAGRIEYRAARHVGLGDEAGGSDVAGRRLPGPGADGTVAELAWRSGATRRLCRTTPDPSRGEREAGTLLASALRPRSGRQASGPAQFGSRLPRGRFPTRTRPSIPSAVPCPHRPSERPRLVSRAASRP